MIAISNQKLLPLSIYILPEYLIKDKGKWIRMERVAIAHSTPVLIQLVSVGIKFMQALPEKHPNPEMPLQLLLFVDKRPSSREQIRQVRSTLEELRVTYAFELQVIDVGEQPYLAEHFKLIATPALVKIYPEPRQTLAGSNLIPQLKRWWHHWQRAAEEQLELSGNLATSPVMEPLEAITDREVASSRGVADVVADHPAIVSLEETTASASRLPMSAISKTSEPAEVRPEIGSIARSAELIRLSDEIFRLKQEKEEMEHQLKFKDQIIAMLAHDLRNPLTAVSIALETLEMGHNSVEGWSSRMTPALTAQLLKHARTQSRAIDHMITDILQAAKGANSELHIQPQKLDLKALCREVLESLRPRFNAKSQRLEQDIPSDLPMVLADGDRVRQVVINLLDNAIKYTPICGTITLSCLHRTSQKVQISVCDNGPGIPEENRERIFEDRYRLERDEAKEGYGIGLSLCQRIVRAHYGQIWVDSNPSKGSCFHFTLPVF
jgi:two-component system clock-associated histidine kinase SasA